MISSLASPRRCPAQSPTAPDSPLQGTDASLRHSEPRARSRADREDALGALLQQVRLPGSGKLISQPRAQRAAHQLLRALRGDHLVLTCVTSTVCGLLQSAAAAILSELDAVCQLERGHGIRTVSLGAPLTALLQSEAPDWLLGLQILDDVQKLVLAPRHGELDLRLLPLVRAVELRIEDPATRVEVFAYEGTCVDAVWERDPVVQSEVNYFYLGTDDYRSTGTLGGEVHPPCPLLADLPALCAPPLARRTSGPGTAPRPIAPVTILGFLTERSNAATVMHARPTQPRFGAC